MELVSHIWSIALYGSETLALIQLGRNYMEYFDMWSWRRMEKIKWPDLVPNEEIVEHK